MYCTVNIVINIAKVIFLYYSYIVPTILSIFRISPAASSDPYTHSNPETPYMKVRARGSLKETLAQDFHLPVY